jgi:hypothetical protein
MATDDIHVDDIGTIFEITLLEDGAAVDIADATAKHLVFQLPDGSTMSKPAVFASDGADGIIQYVTVSGDLSQAGNWKMQAKITTPAGSWSSSTSWFKVYGNLA